MCFAPWASLLTSAIEIAMAAWILSRNPKKDLNRISSLILLLLGLYQFSEFRICTSADALFWGRIAHLAYTLLPALGIHWALVLRGIRSEKYLPWVYAFPAAWMIAVVLSSGFVESAVCSTYFIRIIYGWQEMALFAYGMYYSLFILAAVILLLKGISNENDPSKRKMLSWGLLGMMAFTLPTFFLIILLPSLNIFLPSILCDFGLLFAIAVAYTISLDERIKKRRKR